MLYFRYSKGKGIINMKKFANMKRWFQIKKKMELNDRYYCQRLDAFGEIIGETEKAYKLSVEALFMSGEKNVTIWCPKSCVENVVEA
jgi:hypothetical protein|nr:MAG TPA: hypothetical protein [Caudoviricetes sp.]